MTPYGRPMMKQMLPVSLPWRKALCAKSCTDSCLHLRKSTNGLLKLNTEKTVKVIARIRIIESPTREICDVTLRMPNDEINAPRFSSMEKGQTLTNSRCFSFMEKRLNHKICPTHGMRDKFGDLQPLGLSYLNVPLFKLLRAIYVQQLVDDTQI